MTLWRKRLQNRERSSSDTQSHSLDMPWVSYKWPLENQLCKAIHHCYVHLRACVLKSVFEKSWPSPSTCYMLDPGSVVVCLWDDVSLIGTQWCGIVCRSQASLNCVITYTSLQVLGGNRHSRVFVSYPWSQSFHRVHWAPRQSHPWVYGSQSLWASPELPAVTGH